MATDNVQAQVLISTVLLLARNWGWKTDDLGDGILGFTCPDGTPLSVTIRVTEGYMEPEAVQG